MDLLSKCSHFIKQTWVYFSEAPLNLNYHCHCQKLSYVKPEVDHVSTRHYITSECSLWPHVEHNFNSVKQLTPTLCLSLWLCKTFISRVFFLFVFLSLKPKKLKTLFIIRTSCLHQLKLLMKTGHHTCVLWYRCYTCGLRLQCELIKDLSRSLQVVVDVQFAALDHL